MAEPIRVLHVLGSLNAGGAESITMDIYRNIDRSKIQFDFAIHTDEVLALGARIFTLPRFKGINYFEYKKAWEKLFKKNKTLKIVHGHMTTTAFIYLKIAKKFGIKKRIAHARNSRKDKFIKGLLCKLSRFYSTNLFAVSKDSAIGEFAEKRTKNSVKIIPNGIDYNFFKFDQQVRKEIRELYKISQESSILLHVGRFHPQKNHRFLLQIFKEITYINDNFYLFLIGEGELKETILKDISQYKLQDKIILIGLKYNVSRYMSASDALVFPSLYEGLSGVLIESQINGLKVFTSISDKNEANISNFYNYISLKSPPNLWANKIISEMNKDIERRELLKTDEKYHLGHAVKFYNKFYLGK